MNCNGSNLVIKIHSITKGKSETKSCSFLWISTVKHGPVFERTVMMTSSNGNIFRVTGHHKSGGVSNHQPHDCLLNRLFRRRSKKTSKLRVTGLCVGIPRTNGQPVTRKMFPFDDVIMLFMHWITICYHLTISCSFVLDFHISNCFSILYFHIP